MDEQVTAGLILEDDIPEVLIDHHRFEQIVVCLLQNACQALTDRAQAIHVSLSCDSNKDTVELVVKDEGCGISKENIEKIKEPFFTTKRERGGTGLGLSIVAQIIEDHEGELDVKSTLGNGSEFKVKLPLVKTEA